MATGKRYSSIRTVTRLSAALAFVLMGLLRGTIAPAHAEGALTFGEFPAGTLMTIQYLGDGVNVQDASVPHIQDHPAQTAPATTLPQVINRSFTTDPRSFTTVGGSSQVLLAPTCGCQQNYGVGPLVIDFTQPQQHVSLDTGFLKTQHAGAPRSLVLTAWYNSPAASWQPVASFTSPVIGPDNHITTQLSVDAPQGAQIDRVTVDQTSPSSNATDMDFGVGNLSLSNPVAGFGYKGAPPPSITITSPANGSTIYVSGSTLVSAMINADPSTLPGGWHVDLSVLAPGQTVPVVTSHVGKFLGVLPHVQVHGINASLTTGGVNDIALQLINGSGVAVATDHVDVTVRQRPPPVDVVPRGMEVTQAINRALMYPDKLLNHPHKGYAYQGEPLVQNKKVVVRLYGTVIGPGATSVDYVGAQLSGFVESTGAPLPGSPITPQQGPTGPPDRRITVIPTFSVAEDRLYSSHSWGFVLPISWTQAGRKIRLVGQVNPDHTVPDPNTSDDTFTIAHLQFFPTSTIQIRPRFFIGPVTPPYGQPSVSDYPGASDSAYTDGFLNSLLPVPDGAPQVLIPPNTTFTQCTGEGFLGLSTGNCDSSNQQDYFSHLLSIANTFWNNDNNGGQLDFHPPNTPYVVEDAQINAQTGKLQGGVNGMSNVPSHGIATEVGNSVETTHESIHALGMTHASNAHSESTGGGNESWPYCHAEIAVLCAGNPDTSLYSTAVTGAEPMGFNTAPRGGDLSDWSTARDVAVSDPQQGVAIIKDPIAHAPISGLEPTPGCTPGPGLLSQMHYHEVISYGPGINPNCQNLGAWISDINYCRMFFTFSGLKAPDGSDGHDWCKNHQGFLSPTALAGLGTQAAALRRNIAHAHASAHASNISLRVDGMLDQNFQLKSIALSPSEKDPGPIGKNGKYTAEIVTKSGNKIKVPFDVSFISTHGTPLESFSVSLPYPQDAQDLVILDPAGGELGRVHRPGWQPSLKILTHGGSQTCNGFRLAWSFSNPGSPPGTTGVPPVHYDVGVSSDGGRTFQAFAVSLQDTALAIPQGCSPGGALIFRVTASDGFDTVSVNSARFTLPQAAPTVTITSPSDGLTTQPGILTTFTGQAEDANGNLVPNGSLRWLSDRDGVLGTGSILDTNELSVGTHHITLVATSLAGLSWSTTITVVVSHGAGQPVPGQPARRFQAPARRFQAPVQAKVARLEEATKG